MDPTVEIGFDAGKERKLSGEVHYLLKRRGGGSDLAVLGKEKSLLRHMSYRYAIRNAALFKPYLKLRSRREVVDWLDSIVSGLRFRP